MDEIAYQSLSQCATHELSTSGPARAPGRMTYEEFLEWCDEDTRAEWVDGKVVLLPPATSRHQDMIGFLMASLGIFVEEGRRGKVISTFHMKTGPDLAGRQPDLIFVASDHADCFTKFYLAGPGDLVVEVAAAESRSRDRGDKFYEYEQGGVREYWLIDPIREQAEFYCLGDDGIYQLAPVGEDGIFRSVVLEGLWLKVDWLWQEPLPPLMSVLKEWGLV